MGGAGQPWQGELTCAHAPARAVPAAWVGAGLVALLGLGCSAPPSSGGAQHVTLELVEGACATPERRQPPIAALRSAQAVLTTAQGAQESDCVAGPFADLAALQQGLRAAGVTFTDLAAGEGEIKVLGYAKDGCQEPVPVCGATAFTLAEQTRIEVPVHCWGQADAVPFNLCVDGVANRVVDDKVELGLWSMEVGTMSWPRAEWTDERSHSPDHSLVSSLNEPFDVIWSSRPSPVDSGARYALRYWALLDNLDSQQQDLGVRGCVSWCSENVEYCDRFATSCGPYQSGSTAGWQAYDFQVTAPADAAEGYSAHGGEIKIYVSAYAGSVWIDDISLVEVAP